MVEWPGGPGGPGGPCGSGGPGGPGGPGGQGLSALMICIQKTYGFHGLNYQIIDRN